MENKFNGSDFRFYWLVYIIKFSCCLKLLLSTQTKSDGSFFNSEKILYLISEYSLKLARK